MTIKPMLLNSLLLGLLNMTGCASNPQIIPVAVQQAPLPSVPTCLAAQPQTTNFLAQFQTTSTELEAHLLNASQRLALSEMKLREALSKPTGTQKP